MKKLFLCLAAMVLSSVMVSQTISSSTVSLRFCFDDAETINEEVCPNVGITINGTTYTEAGTYYQNLQTTRGCDSTLTIVITESESCAPEGAINALFSISSTKQVYFSKGNLQYRAFNGNTFSEDCASCLKHNCADNSVKRGIWRFAEHQYDFVGGSDDNGSGGNVYENSIKCTNNSMSDTYTGWIDLFNWGTSGYNGKYPYSTTETLSGENDLTGVNAYYDWGVYNAISNGGNEPGIWRTLTKSEWEYVMSRDGKVAGARVAGVRGILLLPDVWNGSAITNSMLTSDSEAANTYTAEQWEEMESNGAVFLPFNSYRRQVNNQPKWYSLTGVNRTTRYWHASHVENTSDKAYYIWHDGAAVSKPHSPGGAPFGLHVSWDASRTLGFGVRLVADK